MTTQPLSDNEFLFTSGSVTEGHPDKMADQISDGVLDAVMAEDPAGRVACETLVNTGLVVVSGEITTDVYVDIPKIAREPWFVPETTSLFEQLNAFRAKREHFALVVDEYGALMGLVTLEDILEEIVGQIDDEHDRPVEGVLPQADGSVLVAGSVTIRDLNRRLDWSLPDDEAVTVAGLVIHEAQTIPEPGQVFSFHGRRFEITRRRRNQLTQIRITALPAEKTDA